MREFTEAERNAIDAHAKCRTEWEEQGVVTHWHSWTDHLTQEQRGSAPRLGWDSAAGAVRIRRGDDDDPA